MRGKLAGLLAAGLLVAPMAQAAIVFTVDTTTDLRGSFEIASFTGSSKTPEFFRSLPGTTQNLIAGVNNDESRFDLGFFSAALGTPDNPGFSANVAGGQPTSFAALTGSYTNAGIPFGSSGTSAPIYFRYFDFNWDGGDQEGKFTGNFCFSSSATGCTETSVVPLPAAAWLLLSGLAGLGFLGRRRKAA